MSRWDHGPRTCHDGVVVVVVVVGSILGALASAPRCASASKRSQFRCLGVAMVTVVRLVLEVEAVMVAEEMFHAHMK